METNPDCPICEDDGMECVYCCEDEYYMALMESDESLLDTVSQ